MYPYSLHGRLFNFTPPFPQEIPVKHHTCTSLLNSFKTPLPKKFSMTFYGLGMDFSWNYIVYTCNPCLLINYLLMFNIFDNNMAYHFVQFITGFRYSFSVVTVYNKYQALGKKITVIKQHWDWAVFVFVWLRFFKPSWYNFFFKSNLFE